MNYIIYKNKKIPTQSGEKQKEFWVLENTNIKLVEKDMLTGWKTNLSNSIKKLKFESKEEAIEYAKKNSLKFELVNYNKKEIIDKSYANNFKFKRIRTDIK